LTTQPSGNWPAAAVTDSAESATVLVGVLIPYYKREEEGDEVE
jgi:hypothetical protein